MERAAAAPAARTLPAISVTTFPATLEMRCSPAPLLPQSLGRGEISLPGSVGFDRWRRLGKVQHWREFTRNPVVRCSVSDLAIHHSSRISIGVVKLYRGRQSGYGQRASGYVRPGAQESVQEEIFVELTMIESAESLRKAFSSARIRSLVCGGRLDE